MNFCPKCNSSWVGYCSSPHCILSHKPEKKKIDWDQIWRRIRYGSPKDVYYWARNRFYYRWDLIRTGFPKGQYCDARERILYGMMNTLVEFIEDETALEIVNMNFHELDGVRVGDALVDLYIDWKINYPNLQKKEEDALEAWAITKRPFVDGEGLLQMESKNGFTEEESTKRLFAHADIEEEIANFEQDMLNRLIKYRFYMWT